MGTQSPLLDINSLKFCMNLLFGNYYLMGGAYLVLFKKSACGVQKTTHIRCKYKPVNEETFKYANEQNLNKWRLIHLILLCVIKNSYSLGLAGVRCRPVWKIEDLNFSRTILENSMYTGDCCKLPQSKDSCLTQKMKLSFRMMQNGFRLRRYS